MYDTTERVQIYSEWELTRCKLTSMADVTENRRGTELEENEKK